MRYKLISRNTYSRYQVHLAEDIYKLRFMLNIIDVFTAGRAIFS